MEKKIKIIYIINYFHASMDTLNTLRVFTTTHNMQMNLIGNKKINNLKKTNNTSDIIKLQPFIIGKCIIIQAEKILSEHNSSFHSLKEQLKNLNMYINCVIANNIYITPNQLQTLLTNDNIINSLVFNYSFVNFIKLLKLKQLTFSKNNFSISNLTYFNLYSKLFYKII